MDSPLAEVANVLADVAGTNPATGTWRYYSHDHLASTRRMRASDGFSLATYEYTPYGEQYAVSGMASASHQYAMLTWDETAQLHFAPFRYYSPQRSMWISPDPLGMVDGSNTYIYVQAGPIATVDPLGLLAGIIIAGLFIIGARPPPHSPAQSMGLWNPCTRCEWMLSTGTEYGVSRKARALEMNKKQ